MCKWVKRVLSIKCEDKEVVFLTNEDHGNFDFSFLGHERWHCRIEWHESW